MEDERVNEGVELRVVGGDGVVVVEAPHPDVPQTDLVVAEHRLLTDVLHSAVP